MKKNTVAILAAGLLLAMGACAVHAQTVYRIVGPDGRVTFSDTPPMAGAGTAQAGSAGTSLGGTGLPYELQQVASRYPVTLYTGNNCDPCGAGRAFLSARGIPFEERTVTTPEDGEALQRLSGSASLPSLTIGSQQLKGFSDAEWGSFLDAAGYPKTSQLPPGFRPAAATPLVSVQRPAQGTAPATAPGEPGAEAAGRRQRPAPARAPDTNPAGIRF